MKTIIKIILLSMFFTACLEKKSYVKYTKHVTTNYAK